MLLPGRVSTLKASEHKLQSWDGAELFYRFWKPKKKSGRAVILFHRGHEHSGRWQDVIEKINLDEFNIFAWDARGHGQSPGERGYAESFGCIVKDVDTFVRHVSETYDIPYENIVVLAHSVGSVTVSTWVHDYAPPIRALILGSPALRVRLYVPFAVPGLRLLQKLRGKAFISSYVKGRLLTHDPEKIRSYDEDPLITPNIAINMLLGLHDAGTRLIRDSGAITLPVLVLTSGADFVVRQSAQRAFYNGLSNPRREMQTFPGFFHDTFNEKDNHLPIAKARMFIEDVFSRPVEREDLTNADDTGYTKRELDALSKPLSPWTPKGVKFAVTRFLMKTVGCLSTGIRIGWQYGFDSGTMLDYVYRNKATGTTPLGKLMDRMYLNSPGWAGIRQRKINLEKLLNGTIKTLLDSDRDVRIVDVATGHGRYVLDTIKAHSDKPVSALLRDYSDVNIEAGMKLAKELGLEEIVTYRQGNAFEKASLAEIDNNPNVGVVSGLFELFPDNALIRETLTGLHDALETGGYLIYTNQPWHPQLEFIARVLTSHKDGKSWVMRRRTQQEMDQLVEQAGFQKRAMEIDEDGIFSVSLAQKT